MAYLASDGTTAAFDRELVEERDARRRSIPANAGEQHIVVNVHGFIDRAEQQRIQRELDAAPHATAISLNIDSEGGATVPVIDTFIVLRRHPATTKIAVIHDRCQSGAVIVAMAADQRIAHPNSSLLLHPSALSISVNDDRRWTAADLRRKADDLQKIDEEFDELVALRAGCALSAIAEESHDEEPTPIQVALALGLIHEVRP